MFIILEDVTGSEKYQQAQTIYDVLKWSGAKGMVETPDTNAYSIVRVYPDRPEIKGYGREENRILKVAKESKPVEAKAI